MTTQNTETNQLPRGREDDYVMFSTLRPGVRVHRRDAETREPIAWSLYAMNLIRTGEGEWLIDVQPQEGSGPLVKVEVDDAAAVAFRDVRRPADRSAGTRQVPAQRASNHVGRARIANTQRRKTTWKRNANSSQVIPCDSCGQLRPKQQMTGIGSGGAMTWLCSDCVITGKAEDVFAGIMKPVHDAIHRAQNTPEST